jgi:DNA repair protein SbcC/Rad50
MEHELVARAAVADMEHGSGYAPLRLTLKGFKGIRNGLGRDSLTLDFESFANDATLVAIAGANGRGKSTLMDNLHALL